MAKRKLKRKDIMRRMAAFTVVVVAALLSLSVVAHIPAVQKFGIDHIADFLSIATGTRVEVGRFRFNVFNHLQLEEIYVEEPGHPGDTLIYSESIECRFASLLSLVRGELVMRGLYIEDVTLDFTRNPDDEENTLLQWIDNFAFSGARTDSLRNRTPLRFDIRTVRLSNLHVQYDDQRKGHDLGLRLTGALVDFDYVDLAERNLRIESVFLNRPDINLRSYLVPTPLYEADTLIQDHQRHSVAGQPGKWKIAVADLTLDNGSLRRIEYAADTLFQVIPAALDYNDLDIKDVRISLCETFVDGKTIYGSVNEFSFREKSGFELKELSISNFAVADTGVLLEEFVIATPKSRISDNIELEYDGYEAFADFANNVRVDARFVDTRISISDLMTLAPSLRDNVFFVDNRDQIIVLNGRLRGSANRLRGDAIDGRIGDMRLRGDFRTRNLTVPGEQLITARVNSLSLNAEDLRSWLPGLNITEQFDLLGRMLFSGQFDGYPQDFVAYGALETDLGSADVDMRIDITEGAQKANYSGNLSLTAFDLGKWSGTDQLGLVTLSAAIKDGKGLTSENAAAVLVGDVSSISLKGYEYQDIKLNGRLVNRYFNGDFAIRDDNVDLVFNGILDFREEDPEFDFRVDIDTMDLRALNITADSLTLKGRYTLRGLWLDNREIDGIARASDVEIRRGSDQLYTLDTVDLRSFPGSDGSKHYVLRSDYINGEVKGYFEVSDIVPALNHYLKEHYPRAFRNMAVSNDPVLDSTIIEFNISLNQPEEWIGLVGRDEVRFSNLYLRGGLNVPGDTMNFYLSAPYFKFGGIEAYGLRGNVSLENTFASSGLDADSIVSGDITIDGVSAGIQGERQLFDWYLTTNTYYDTLELDLVGTFTWDTLGRAVISLNDRFSNIFSNEWSLNKGNRISWGKQYINFQNFELVGKDQAIRIEDIDSKGIRLSIDNFDVHYIDAIWDYDKLDFFGRYSVRAEVDNIFEPGLINGLLTIPDLQVNGDSYGALQATVSMDDPESPVEIALALDRPGSHVSADGAYYTAGDKVDPSLRNTFAVNLRLDTFPARFLEYFLVDNIQGTEGYAIGQVILSGDSSGVDMNGTVRTYGFETYVDYLGVRYRILNHDVDITRDYIDLTGARIVDGRGNQGRVTGGLTHQMFANLGLDLNITSNGITALNTTGSDNEVYYGYAFGAVDVDFIGPTTGPGIRINATVGPETHIYIPLDRGSSSDGGSFLKFVERDSSGNIVETEIERRTTGVDLEMNLSINPAALVEIIFDESTQDILSGRGTGDLQMSVARTGEVDMYGNVEVESGNYLFSNFAVVTKPFVIRPGGTIRWTGDPGDAEISMSAEYSRINTSLSTLLQEYLVNASPSAQAEARLNTSVLLELLLSGSLLEPTINFDIEFPDVSGELAGLVSSKMNTLNADQNALNEQVFGLLWAGTFLPGNLVQQSSTDLAQVGITNTLSEFISSQLSLFLSDFISGAIEDVDFISGIDFNVGYNQSYDYYQQSYSYTQWELSVQNRLFNDRFIVDVGGNYVTDSPVSGEYFAGDYALEYILTEDRRLKVRFYHRNEETIEGRRNRTGIGLAYRREFDSFKEWLKGLDNQAKKMRDRERPSSLPDGPN